MSDSCKTKKSKVNVQSSATSSNVALGRVSSPAPIIHSIILQPTPDTLDISINAQPTGSNVVDNSDKLTSIDIEYADRIQMTTIPYNTSKGTKAIHLFSG